MVVPRLMLGPTPSDPFNIITLRYSCLLGVCEERRPITALGDADSEVPHVGDIEDAVDQAREVVSGSHRGQGIRGVYSE